MDEIFKVFITGQVAMVLTARLYFSYFHRGWPKDHSYKDWLKLVKWYMRGCHLKQIVDDTQHLKTPIANGKIITILITTL